MREEHKRKRQSKIVERNVCVCKLSETAISSNDAVAVAVVAAKQEVATNMSQQRVYARARMPLVNSVHLNKCITFFLCQCVRACVR